MDSDSVTPGLPNLLIIGAMKASTTLLYSLLQQHPQVWFPTVKEPRYFSQPDDQLDAGWDDYRQLFASCPAGVPICGEASTTYTRAPHAGPVAERIRDRLGSPHLIYILRDPTERTISHYKHSYVSGFYPPGTTIREALQDDPILLDTSRYARQLRPYREVFGQQQPLLLIADELHVDPLAVLAQVEQHLGISANPAWRQGQGPALPETNSAAQLGVSRRFGTDSALLRPVKKLLPAGLKRRLLRRLSAAVKIPPIDDDDRRFIAAELADDAALLRRELGDRIAAWPTFSAGLRATSSVTLTD